MIENTINGAEHSIDVAMFYMNSQDIANWLIAAQQRGVKVRIVFDDKSYSSPVSFHITQEMKAKGVLVRDDKYYGTTGARMHDKYMIVDNKTVQTGSFNYKNKSEHGNAENVIVIRDNPSIAAKYLGDWQKHWDEAVE